MKRFILVLFLCVIASSAYCQRTTFFNCFSVEIHKWNTYSKEWVKQTDDDADYTVRFTNSSFTFENESGTVYILKNLVETKNFSDRHTAIWNGIDEEAITCTVMTTKYNENSTVIVSGIYKDIMLKFYLRPQ